MKGIRVYFLVLCLVYIQLKCQGSCEQIDLYETDSSDLLPQIKTAHILSNKHFQNKYVVQQMDLVVQYDLYNVGKQTAFGIHLRDTSFDNETHFRHVIGLTDVVFKSLPPGGNITHTIVVQPLRHGQYITQPAEITYSDVHTGLIFGTSSVPEPVRAYTIYDFRKKYPYVGEEWVIFAQVEWIAFGVMVSACLLVPYMLWFNSNSKYETILANKMGKTKEYYRKRT